MRAHWFAFSALLAAGPAYAECGGPYGASDLLGAYQTVQFMLASGDDEAVVDAGIELEAGLGCLSDKVPPALFAGVYRALGAANALGGDNEKALKWFLTARQLDSTSGFGVDELPFDSPVRAIFDEAIGESVVAPIPVQGKALAAPEDSIVLLDGKKIDVAAATPNRFHMVQLAFEDGRIRRSWLIEGNAFPAILLGEPVVVVEVEEIEEEQEDDKEEALEVLVDPEGLPTGYDASDFVRLGRDRPRWKTPSLVTGGVAIAGSLALYGASFYTRGRFDEATTEADLYHYQQLTNRLSAGSGALLILGGASTSWGVLLSDSPGLGIRVPW